MYAGDYLEKGNPLNSCAKVYINFYEGGWSPFTPIVMEGLKTVGDSVKFRKK